MEDTRQNAQSRLEMLTGLSLFDAGSVPEERIREYRHFGFRLDRERPGAEPLSNLHKIGAWYHAFMPGQIKETAATVTGYLRLISLIVGILAFVTGAGAAGYLFYYDGTAPVNVLPVLALFAFLPLLLLLLSAGYAWIGSLSSGHLPLIFRWIEGPVRSRIRKAVGEMSDKTDYSTKSGLSDMRGNASEIWLVHSEPVRYFLKQNLQLAGTAYLTGALLWMLFNVITTDLAFSWSSTLEVEGETLYSITRIISTPWARIVPSAVVDSDTVEATRYYRADRGDFQAVSSGRWWAFIFMTILVYGFLPKALGFAWYRWRFISTTDQAILASDSGSRIIGFMEELLVTTKGNDENNSDVRTGILSEKPVKSSDNCVVLFWGLGETDTSGIQNVLNRKVIFARHIGGFNSSGEDSNILMECARLSLQSGNCDILVLIPFEESPTIRLEKKLHLLLVESSQSRVIIMPVIEDSTRNRKANEVNWRTRIDQINEAYGRKRVYLDAHNIIDSNRLTGVT